MPGGNVRPRIVVVGAGPVGTLAALYAAKRGLQVDVYDLRDDLRKSDTTPLNFTKSINLALSERGIHALRHAGDANLLDAILADAVPMHARMIHGSQDSGELFQESQSYDAEGRSIKAVDRGSLNKSLLDALDRMANVTLHFNHKLTGANFDQKTAWFEQLIPSRKTPTTADDGRPKEIAVDFHFLVGADGAHSATRFHLMKFARLNYQQEYIDTLWCEFSIKPTKAGRFAISPDHLHIWPAGSFMFIAIPSADGSFTCTLFASAAHFAKIKQNTEIELPAFFQKHFHGVCPDLIPKSALLQQFQNSPHLPLISIKCTPYHYNSSVVILGDAAHAMVPFYGQGMNAGLEDVRILFAHLDAHDSFDRSAKPDEQSRRRADALKTYTAQRTPDAHTINDLAMGNYREMSDGVRSQVYKVRKWLEESVSVYLPWMGWRTQYTRVSFENQRYSEVVSEVRRQGNTLLIGMVLAPIGIGALAFAAWRLRR